MQHFKALMLQFPLSGKVEWIGLRPRYRAAIEVVDVSEAKADYGLIGDHSAERGGGKRQITLIQAEHLEAIAKLLRRERIDPALVRRNLVVSGLNLLALKDREFVIGGARLIGTGPCAPCARMEEVLGRGGFNAMRGHGGITARVLQSGIIRLGDEVRVDDGVRVDGAQQERTLDLWDDERPRADAR